MVGTETGGTQRETQRGSQMETGRHGKIVTETRDSGGEGGKVREMSLGGGGKSEPVSTRAAPGDLSPAQS